MMWFVTNIGTIVVGLILLAIVVAIVWSLIKDKRSGKSSCGSGCTSCSMCGSCHPQNEVNKSSRSAQRIMQ